MEIDFFSILQSRHFSTSQILKKGPLFQIKSLLTSILQTLLAQVQGMTVLQPDAMINAAESIAGRPWKDRTLLWEALQTSGSGVFMAGTRLIPEGNKRLAVVGDSVMKTVLAEHYYKEGAYRGA